MKNKSFSCAFVFSASLLLTACGGSYTVTRFDQAAVPGQLRSAAITPNDGNSAEVTGYVKEALTGKGVAVTEDLPPNSIKSDRVDVVASYQDVWRWDLTTYLQSISINLYNAKTGELMVTGRWRDSFFHTWNRGEAVSMELIQQMFEKLGLSSGAGKVASSRN